VAERLAATQEGLSSVELVRNIQGVDTLLNSKYIRTKQGDSNSIDSDLHCKVPVSNFDRVFP
jgi:hypothetical protein